MYPLTRKIALTLFACAISLWTWADIPSGKNVYLDVSQCTAWQGAPSYLLHLSRTSMTHVLQPVTGKTHLYVFTTIASTQDNLNFGLGKTAVTSDFSGWFGNYVSANIERSGWTASTPVFVIDCPAGSSLSGHWEALPANDTIKSVTYTTSQMRCVDSTYTLEVNVTLSGSAATLRISGDLLTSDRIIPQCKTPYKTTIQSKWVDSALPIVHTLTFSACADAAGTSVNNTVTIDIEQPELICSSTDSIEVCSNESTVTLETTRTGDSLQWLDANDTPLGNTPSITIANPGVRSTYSVQIFEPYINPNNNLMVNGNFENGYSGFMSDYEPIRDKVTNQPVLNPTWIYSNKYKNGTDYGKYYCITNDAYDLQESQIFAHIKPHGGEEFLVVDATNQGYAWYTNTTQSPKLVLHAGQTYLFSYWVACPNTGEQLEDPKAQLQFIIELHMPDGSTKKAQLTETYTVGSEEPVNDWYYQEVKWYCPYDCNDVTIGVKDLTESAGGNDFCLDDIIFQPIESSSMRLAWTEYKIVKMKDCGPEPPEPPEPKECVDVVYAKWDDVLFVNNGETGLKGKAVSYQWYKDSVAIAGATDQSYYAPDGSMASGSYYAVITLSDGSQVSSCAQTFADTEHSVSANPGSRQVLSRRIFHVMGALYMMRTEYEDGTFDITKIIRL